MIFKVLCTQERNYKNEDFEKLKEVLKELDRGPAEFLDE